jgi:1,4-alpha-glucan branching enzyme
VIRSTDRARLLAGEHSSPHSILGLHPDIVQGVRGATLRAYHPDAASCECLLDGDGWRPLQAEAGGLFSSLFASVSPPRDYRLRFGFRDGATWERRDPYRFLPTLGDLDLHLFGEGKHRDLWKLLGAHPRRMDGIDGVSFAVWAPNARRVSVLGDFCAWDARLFPMRHLGASGVFELFVPDVAPGALYKYEILTREGMLRVKADPLGLSMEQPPGTASGVARLDSYEWGDGAWMTSRRDRHVRREPVLVYEVHLGSWARVPEEGNRWLTYREIHVDGLRVDAVASMLYLDYSRKPGQWVPNRYGGRENLEAIQFLRELNATIAQEEPGCFTVAEESTAFPGVTRPVEHGGLGFTFKWNMGWMHDTLRFFARDPLYRRHHQDDLTFSMLYEYTEQFLMPLSHDEVVHAKGSLLGKMAGDTWQKFANLRLLLAYQYTRPGKALLFMGTELAPEQEWSHDRGLDWRLMEDPIRAGWLRFLEELGSLYRRSECLWKRDGEPAGFQWIDCSDRDNSVISYIRRDGERYVIVICNFTPIPRPEYRLGVPEPVDLVCVLSSDDSRFGGSGLERPPRLSPLREPAHGFAQSIRFQLPPLAAVILAPDSRP